MFRHTAYYTVVRIRFQFRKTRTNVDPTTVGTLQAVIKIEGQKPSLPISTTIQCTRGDWDNRHKPRPSNAVQLLIKSMVKWEESIYSAAKTLFDSGEPITAQTLLVEKNSKAANLPTLVQVFNAYLAYKKSCIGSTDCLVRHTDQISPTTFVTYEKRWKYVRDYLKERGDVNMLAYKADAGFVTAYRGWLRGKTLAAPTVTKYTKILSEVLNWGIEQGIVKNLTVGGFSGSTTQAVTPPHNVTESEVERIEALKLESPKMAAIRDGWLLARELCLHFSDYLDLKAEHFTLDKENRIVFEKARRKQEAGRNIRQVAFVSERALSIWKRYNYQIPFQVNNTEFNGCLKEIGYLAGLSQPLMFSHARDSGIFRWVAAGVPDAQTRLAAGWRSMQQLSRYVNFDRRLLNELSISQGKTFNRPLPPSGGPRLMPSETTRLAS